MGRKPACSSSNCELCGFGKQGGIPTCTALKTSTQLVKWVSYKSIPRPGKKPLLNQQVEQEGKLCDLWADFEKHSTEYIAHHTKAKWQTNSHGLCLATFEDGDIQVETDFAEKYSHVPAAVLTCDRHPQTTLMIAIVHFSPQLWDGGGRVHQTETWIFASDESDHDFDFHLHALLQIADYYLDGPGGDATAAAREDGRIPRMHMFTDGCAKQYKGARNFRFLSDSVRQLGFIVEHHFAATSHFKGCHDGIGGVAKNAMKASEVRGNLIAGAAGVVEFLERYFHHIGEGYQELKDYFATWSPYRIRCVHVKLIKEGAIHRPGSKLKGIKGTRELYVFVGANTARPDTSTTTRLGSNEDVPDVVERDWWLARETDVGEVEGTELAVKQARAYVPWSSTWGTEVVAAGRSPDDGEEAKGEGEEGGGSGGPDGVRRGGRARRPVAKFALVEGSDEEEEEEEEEEKERWGDVSESLLGARRGGRVRKPVAKFKLVEGSSSDEELEEEASGGDLDPSEGEEQVRSSEEEDEDEVEDEKDEDEEERGTGEGGGPLSGLEMVRVEKVVIAHKLYTSSASCFCSACRRREYNHCYSNSMYSGLAPIFRAAEVEETVIMDTGVDPVVRVNPVFGHENVKEPKEIEFGKRQSFCMMKRLTGTQFGDSFCNST